MSGEVWTQVYDRLAELIREHRTTLVFVNTRRLTERVARHLSERLGEENVAAHHGSLSKERRHNAEQRLKRGELQVLVATASLELGIDIGDVDLVCQIGSTRSINTFLQRVGRAGHSVGGVSKGRLFPLSRDDWWSARRCSMPFGAANWTVSASRKMPLTFSRSRSPPRLRRANGGRTRCSISCAAPIPTGNCGARNSMNACTCWRKASARAGAPRRAAASRRRQQDAASAQGRAADGDHFRRRHPGQRRLQGDAGAEGLLVGTVNEDFAVESLQGDVFQLGNTSYRILRVERGTVRVEDAHGQPPSIPFWLGEAPGRTMELSAAVSRLRQEIEQRLEMAPGTAMRWLIDTVGIDEAAAFQLVQYLSAGRAALGCLPTLDTVVFERFFDESGGMQLVIHSTFGSRVIGHGDCLAQAVLPDIQLRTAGRGDRRSHRPFADSCA